MIVVNVSYGRIDLLHDKHVVNPKHIDIVDSLGLECVEVFDVPRDMRIAGCCKRSGDTNLTLTIHIVSIAHMEPYSPKYSSPSTPAALACQASLP